jgi:hypothetical protein
MKIVYPAHKEVNNIDNEWSNFLMGAGCCDREEGSSQPIRHVNKYNKNGTYKNTNKSSNSNLNDACKKKMIETITTIPQYSSQNENDTKYDCQCDSLVATPVDTNTNTNEMETKKQIPSPSYASYNAYHADPSCKKKYNKHIESRHNYDNHDGANYDDNDDGNDANDDDNDYDDDDGNDHNDDNGNDAVAKVPAVPTCSPIYISTKTKISFLNTPIDIKKVFWDIPIMPYASQRSGIIKKQIKFSCTTKEELEEIEAHTQKEIDKNDGFIETQIIEHIDNPDGRIKFKDHRKINIGLSKKDILNCRSKKKRAFFNCFVLIIRLEDENSPPDARIFKEMHIKVFNTGKLEIPGIQHDDSMQNVIDILIRTLKVVVGEHIECKKDNCETVLINSNFNCGFYIDRDKLYNILKYKYRINSNYDSCSYPGIQCKFFYYVGCAAAADRIHIQNGQQPATNLPDYIEISFMIFRTGSVLIVGKCEDYVLHDIYDFIKELFRVEFLNIYSHIIQPDDDVVKKHVPKLRTRTIVNSA